MLLATIDVGLLFEVVWASAIAGAVVSTLFALVVLFSARSAETRRAGHGTIATIYGAGAVLAFVLFIGLVVYAVHIMLSKS